MTLQVLPPSHSLTSASGFLRVARREAERTEARCDQNAASLGQWPPGGRDPVGTTGVLCWSCQMVRLCSGAPCRALTAHVLPGCPQLKSDSLMQCPL